jgi:hypothetical protein
MAGQRRVIADVAENIWHDSFEWSTSSTTATRAATWSVRQRRLRGGLSDGVDVVEIDNGALRLEILPTRGMGIWRGDFQGTPLGWDSPVKLPVHPKFVHQTERGGLGWLAGFNELICRCGLAFLGPPGRDADFEQHPILGELTLHGKIANLPAHRVEVSVDDSPAGRIAVTGIIDECSMFGPCLRLTSTLETAAGSNSFRIIDEVTNLSAKPAEFELLYHTNIGRPFLGPGARFLAAAAQVCPRDARAAEGIATFDRYEAPDPNYAEQAYFFQLVGDVQQCGLVALCNAEESLAFSMKIPLNQLPCFTLWKNTADDADGYVTGLEPGTNYPNLRSFERARGRVTTLAPHESRRVSFEMTIHPNSSSVAQLAREIAALQATAPRQVWTTPQSQFSSAG